MKIFCSITEYRSVNVKLEEVKAELRENRRFIRSVLQILQQQVNNASDPFELPQGVHLPLTSTAQLEDMNKRLQDDASYRKRLVSYDSSQRINTYCFLRVFEGRFLTQIQYITYATVNYNSVIKSWMITFCPKCSVSGIKKNNGVEYPAECSSSFLLFLGKTPLGRK